MADDDKVSKLSPGLVRGWGYLDDERRRFLLELVSGWLDSPDPGAGGAIADALLDLAIDRLVSDAHRSAMDAGPDEAGSLARVFLADLQTVAAPGRGRDAVVKELATGVVCWWSRERRVGGGAAVAPADLADRCADQTAAVLVFQSLHARYNPVSVQPVVIPYLSDTNRCWQLLFERVVRKILLPKVRQKASLERPLRESEVPDLIQGWMTVIFEKCARPGAFEYLSLSRAIAYFANACYWSLVKRPTEPKLCPLTGIDEPISPVNPDDNAEPMPPAGRQESSAPIRISLGWDGDQRPQRPDRAGPSSPVPIEDVWRRMIAKLKRQDALIFWMLFRLREDRGLKWSDIALYSAQPCCKILSDQDLPPGAVWDEVHRAFEQMAKRSHTSPARLSSDGLRQFYSRHSRVCQDIYAEGRIRAFPESSSPEQRL